MNRKKKKTDNQGDTEEVVLEEEQQAVEEEIETREAEVEEDLNCKGSIVRVNML